MIKKIVKYGSVFIAGYVVGGTVEQATRPSKSNEDPFQVWRGKTREVTWSHKTANDMLEKIDYWLNHPETKERLVDRPFWQDDLKDLRRKLLHRDENGNEFTIEITDRQRLLLYDLTIGRTTAEIRGYR